MGSGVTRSLSQGEILAEEGPPAGAYRGGHNSPGAESLKGRRKVQKISQVLPSVQ